MYVFQCMFRPCCSGLKCSFEDIRCYWYICVSELLYTISCRRGRQTRLYIIYIHIHYTYKYLLQDWLNSLQIIIFIIPSVKCKTTFKYNHVRKEPSIYWKNHNNIILTICLIQDSLYMQMRQNVWSRSDDELCKHVT